MSRFKIFQICYDNASLARVEPGFLRLDTRTANRPDWYEFWPMLGFLSTQELDPSSWYGFVSPRFSEKTRIRGTPLLQRLSQIEPHHDVALLSSHIREIALYQNVFEQQEAYLPGFLALSQNVISTLGVDYDVTKRVGTLLNSVFSNYVVARPAFWRDWLALARRFHQLCERSPGSMDLLVPYADRRVPVKVFIQERLMCLLLATRNYRTYVPPEHLSFQFLEEPERKVLVRCEKLKTDYLATGDLRHLDAFKELRRRHYASRYALG